MKSTWFPRTDINDELVFLLTNREFKIFGVHSSKSSSRKPKTTLDFAKFNSCYYYTPTLLSYFFQTVKTVDIPGMECVSVGKGKYKRVSSFSTFRKETPQDTNTEIQIYKYAHTDIHIFIYVYITNTCDICKYKYNHLFMLFIYFF